MTTIKRKILMNALKLFDSAVLICAFLSAAVFVLQKTHNVSATAFFEMRVKVQNFVLFAGLVILWHLIFQLLALYRSRRLSSRTRESADIVAATSLAALATLLAAWLFHIRMVTPLFLLAFWLESTVAIVSARLVLRLGLVVLRKRGRNLRNVIVVGTNNRALAFANRLSTHPELGYHIAGFVDQKWDGLEPFLRRGYQLVSDIIGFPEYLRRAVVDEVVIGLPVRSMHDRASFVATCCEEQGVTVRVLNNLFDVKVSRPIVQEVEGDALLMHGAGWIEGWPVLVKRIVDLAISLVCLILVSPILAVAAVLIKLTSPGPVLFIQKRVGLHKRPINVYKLRTMEVGAEKKLQQLDQLNEADGPVFKIKKDPRITPIGRILRKTSVDELPQLFNVLKGEMSLVGPRPLPFRDYEGFNEDWQRRRFSVKPGITCLWQVRGRSSIPFSQWMELDLQYIERWSLWLDLQILLQTIPAVLKGSGAR